MSFTVIDYIFLAFILIFALSALFKGFINELFGKAAFILGILGSVLFYDKASSWFIGKIENDVIRNIVGFIAIFVIIFVVLKLVGMLLSKLFDFSILKSLDKIFGFAFGCIEGAAIVGFIIFVLQIQPFFDAQKLFNDSYIYSIFSKVVNSPEFKEIQQNV